MYLFHMCYVNNNVMNPISPFNTTKRHSLKYSREIFPQIFQVTMPLIVGKPGPVNAYLFIGDHVTLLDTGTSDGVKKIECALHELGLRIEDIDQILITHGHGDHCGAAHGIVSKAGKTIPVAAHPDEVRRIETGMDVTEQTMRNFRQLMGFPGGFERELRVISRFLRLIAKNCSVDIFLNHGDKIRMGNYVGQVIYTPGHAKGEICFYLQKENILFSGDHIIDHITPNAFVMLDDNHQLPVRMSQKEFMSSVDRVVSLAPSVVFPGHGKEIRHLNALAGRYRKEYTQNQTKIISALSLIRGSVTVYDLTCRIFPQYLKNRSGLDLSMAVFDIYTHLQIIESKGIVSFTVKDNLLINSNKDLMTHKCVEYRGCN